MTEIMTVQDVQAYLKLPKPTIYTLAQGGRIPAAKIGRHWRFRRVDIDTWIVKQQTSERPLQRRHRTPKVVDGSS